MIRALALSAPAVWLAQMGVRLRSYQVSLVLPSFGAMSDPQEEFVEIKLEPGITSSLMEKLEASKRG